MDASSTRLQARWALDHLHCPACGRQPLTDAAEFLECSGCATRFPVVDGIPSFLAGAHDAVQKERRAIAQLDAGEATLPVADPVIAADDPQADAEAAARAFDEHVASSRKQLLAVLDAHPLAAGSVLVELGADSCWASSLFLDAGCRVLAIDITDHLRLADRADNPDLCRVNADMNRLPIADGSVDVVWANAAAHHSWDLAQTFAEAARVLRPGGLLRFCCEPMPSWWRYPFGLGVGDAERALGINESWVPRARWLRLARRAGFDARLEFPQLDDQALAARLTRRRLPGLLAPWLRPFLRPLQVSIHLLGVKI